jgi:hypothetical protein
MVQITIDIKEEVDIKIGIHKAKQRLSSKADAINDILESYFNGEE